MASVISKSHQGTCQYQTATGKHKTIILSKVETNGAVRYGLIKKDTQHQLETYVPQQVSSSNNSPIRMTFESKTKVIMTSCSEQHLENLKKLLQGEQGRVLHKVPGLVKLPLQLTLANETFYLQNEYDFSLQDLYDFKDKNAQHLKSCCEGAFCLKTALQHAHSKGFIFDRFDMNTIKLRKNEWIFIDLSEGRFVDLNDPKIEELKKNNEEQLTSLLENVFKRIPRKLGAHISMQNRRIAEWENQGRVEGISDECRTELEKKLAEDHLVLKRLKDAKVLCDSLLNPSPEKIVQTHEINSGIALDTVSNTETPR